MPPTTSLKQLPVTLCNKQKSSNTFVNLWKLTETRRSFRKLHTVDELREFVDNNEISLIDYMISTIDEDVSTAAGRSRYVARGAEILSHVSDGVIFDNCVKLLALESLSSLSTVREAVGKVDEVSDNFSLADPDDDGCGVGCEEVFVVAQSSFLDDGTVFDGDVGVGEGARDTEADCFRVEGVFLEGGQVGDECGVEVVGVNAGP